MAAPSANLDDKEIIAAIKIKVRSHYLEYEAANAKVMEHGSALSKYTTILHMYGVPPDEITVLTSPNQVVENSDTGNEKIEPDAKITFIDHIEQILSDGQPRLTAQLLDEYVKKTGNEIKNKDFSSKLAIRAKRTGKIKNIGYRELSIDRRYWWGLSTWFNTEGDFRQEYKIKIPDLNKPRLAIV